MMNSKLKIGLILAVSVIILSLGWWFWDLNLEETEVSEEAEVLEIHPPIDEDDSKILIQKFCENKDKYEYERVMELGNRWLIPIRDTQYYAIVNKDDANTLCNTRITNKTVIIDSTIKKARFIVDWLYKKGDIDLILRRPDGRIIDSTVAATEQDIRYVNETAYELYEIETHPMRGTWVMYMIEIKEVEHNANAMLDGYGTNIDVMKEGNVSSVLYFDKEDSSLNEPIKFIVTVTERGEPITDAIIDITVKKPDNTKQYFLLYDDGEHGDGVSLDGVYANWYTDTYISGFYEIQADISGNDSNGKPFALFRSQSMSISAKTRTELSITPKKWDAEMYLNETLHTDLILSFSVNLTSNKDEPVVITFTDFKSNGDTVKPNTLAMPSIFVVKAGGSGVMYGRIILPEDVNKGIYVGHMILESTMKYISVPITINVK